jgi:FkbM family methyltransferase
VDGDVVVELDMAVPGFRYLYFHHDLSSEPEAVLLRALLRQGDIFVDAGSHIGVFSLLAAKYAAHVHAFEISPGTVAYLRRNLSLNPALAPRITLHAVGLAEQAGEMVLYNSAGQPDLASLRPLDRPDAYSETVRVATLDAELADVRITGLKIDVEGAELGVLRGAQQHIAATQPWILVELFEPFQARFGASCAEIDNFLRERGYRGYLLQGAASGRKGALLQPLDLARLDGVQVNNALYVTEQSAHLLPADLVTA